MRNIMRIYSILKRVTRVWLKQPDLRLGQLILNVVDAPFLYYVEDDELIERIEHFYSEQNEKCIELEEKTKKLKKQKKT